MIDSYSHKQDQFVFLRTNTTYKVNDRCFLQASQQTETRSVCLIQATKGCLRWRCAPSPGPSPTTARDD